MLAVIVSLRDSYIVASRQWYCLRQLFCCFATVVLPSAVILLLRDSGIAFEQLYCCFATVVLPSAVILLLRDSGIAFGSYIVAVATVVLPSGSHIVASRQWYCLRADIIRSRLLYHKEKNLSAPPSRQIFAEIIYLSNEKNSGKPFLYEG